MPVYKIVVVVTECNLLTFNLSSITLSSHRKYEYVEKVLNESHNNVKKCIMLNNDRFVISLITFLLLLFIYEVLFLANRLGGFFLINSVIFVNNAIE